MDSPTRQVIGGNHDAPLERRASFDEGLPSFCPPILFCMDNPYSYKKCR
jgi:hypothetical protein